MGVIKGYKIMTADMRALINPDMQYELNKVYKYDGELKLCASGYHWSDSVFNAVTSFDVVYLCLFSCKCKCYAIEVDDAGQIIYGVGKNVSDNIRIVSEIPLDEVLRLYDEDIEIEEELSTKGMSKHEHTSNLIRFFTHLFFKYGYSDRYLYEEFVDLVESDFTKKMLTFLCDTSEKRKIFLEALYKFVSSKYFHVQHSLSTDSRVLDKTDYQLSKDELMTAVSRMYKAIGSLSESIGIPLCTRIGYGYRHLRFAWHLKEGDDKDE